MPLPLAFMAAGALANVGSSLMQARANRRADRTLRDSLMSPTDILNSMRGQVDAIGSHTGSDLMRLAAATGGSAAAAQQQALGQQRTLFDSVFRSATSASLQQRQQVAAMRAQIQQQSPMAGMLDDLGSAAISMGTQAAASGGFQNLFGGGSVQGPPGSIGIGSSQNAQFGNVGAFGAMGSSQQRPGLLYGVQQGFSSGGQQRFGGF